MKKLLIIILLFAGTVSAQDSTIVLNVSLPAQLIEYLTPSMAVPEDEGKLKIFLKWRTALRNSKVTGTTPFITDTIQTTMLAGMYHLILSAENGLVIGVIMRTALTTPRKNNKYLDRLCTEEENFWASVLVDRRAKGRKLLLGK